MSGGGGRSLSALLREGARVGARPGKGGSKSRCSPGGGRGVNKKNPWGWLFSLWVHFFLSGRFSLST